MFLSIFAAFSLRVEFNLEAADSGQELKLVVELGRIFDTNRHTAVEQSGEPLFPGQRRQLGDQEFFG